jgi:hypothetical protein
VNRSSEKVEMKGEKKYKNLNSKKDKMGILGEL